jgi:phosphate transport system substrate-binding protein
MAPGWQASVEAACPGMTFEYQYDISENADLVFTNIGLGASNCKPSLTVPFAVDAAVIVYQLSDGNTFNFTPELLTKIFSGEIKDWSDPLISEVNLGAVYAPGPITIRATAFKPALDALTNWMKRFDSSFDSSKIKSSVTAEAASDFNLGEGEIAILPNSIAQELAYMPAGVIAGKDFSVDVVNPDFSSISSAATQFDFESTETELNVTHNSKLKPQPAPGQVVASPPYVAVFVAPLVICGEASLTKRAAARFILRQDQQGAIGATYFVPIPETIRVGALAIVSEGLTLPVIDPENLPAE